MKTKETAQILVYGLQRSGTNYLHSCLTNNLPVKISNSSVHINRLSWRHKHCRLFKEQDFISSPDYRGAAIPDSFSEIEALFDHEIKLAIVISKDPYAWVISLQDWAIKNDWPPPPCHPILDYRAFYRKWRELSKTSHKIIFLRYEDLLLAPEKLIQETSRNLFLASISKPLNFEQTVSFSETFSMERRRYYLECEYLNRFCNEQIEEIERIIGSDLLQFLDYPYYRRNEHTTDRSGN